MLKRSLPTVPARWTSAAPSPEEATAALGGIRGPQRVELLGRTAHVAGEAGVVLSAEHDRIDVWLGDGRIARLDGNANVGSPHAALGEQVRRFAECVPGQAVLVDRHGHTIGGTLVELCRAGALVQSDRGLLAVAFTCLRPMASS